MRVLYFSLGKELTRWVTQTFLRPGNSHSRVQWASPSSGMFSLGYALCRKESIFTTVGTRLRGPQAKTLPCANTGILFVGCCVWCWVARRPRGRCTIWERNSDIPVGSVAAWLLEEQRVLGFHLNPAGHYSCCEKLKAAEEKKAKKCVNIEKEWEWDTFSCSGGTAEQH